MLGSFALVSCNRDNLAGGRDFFQERLDDDDDDDPSGACVLPSGCPCPPDPADLLVKVNELMLVNDGVLEDETGEFPAWIEIYNPGDVEINLGGVAMSDSLLDQAKWVVPCIPEAIVPPGEFLVIFADGRANELGGLHASFTLEPEIFSGAVQVVVNGGSDIVEIEKSKVETLLATPDLSAGRFPDGQGSARLGLLLDPTPGAPNSDFSEPPTADEGQFVRGDGNLDNRVSIADMTVILRVLFQSREAPECLDRLDANDDGQINATDSVFIGNSIFQNGDAIPPPFPERGVDPTEDGLACPADADVAD